MTEVAARDDNLGHFDELLEEASQHVELLALDFEVIVGDVTLNILVQLHNQPVVHRLALLDRLEQLNDDEHLIGAIRILHQLEYFPHIVVLYLVGERLSVQYHSLLLEGVVVLATRHQHEQLVQFGERLGDLGTALTRRLLRQLVHEGSRRRLTLLFSDD